MFAVRHGGEDGRRAGLANQKTRRCVQRMGKRWLGLDPYRYGEPASGHTHQADYHIGNVQVDANYLGQPGDVSVDTSNADLLSSWKRYANASRTGKTPVIMQINHPGRQSPLGAGKRSLFAKALAPSPIPMNMGDGFIAKMAVRILFGTPKEMTEEDIKTVVSQFATAARLAAESGFDGVEVHAAHGYLLCKRIEPWKTRLDFFLFFR
ncbi:NADH:flavin oxidoreductase/NADH oxidase [Macrophomina phaseolina MS6]|uniref:NADH:flavin oxidoreductase/NADH oxidase n=1 Tax=Macrophomina phaseolina (strain MS6) TaxID=1126212 RepID=K2RHY4_MACPH|nr:NADH:flavin oxidoreductase/NADH oxidase [Macrophomina phaseolina MS6]